MEISIADPIEEAGDIFEAAKDFISRMNFTEFLPGEEADLAFAIGNIITKDEVEIAIAKKDGKLIGAIGMAYVPHMWNPKILTAEEIFWWASKEAPNTMSIRMLKFVKQRAKDKKVKVLTFVKLTSSPSKVGKVYERMGLKEVQTSYSGVL